VSRGALLPALVAILILAPACAPDQPAADRPPMSSPGQGATDGVDSALVPFYTQPLEWENCHDELHCTTVEVPLDYAAPDGETIELSVLRRPATGDDRIGSLLVNPGGPGASGVEYARRSVVNDDVAERFDIVGFDPRGVGQSSPVDCLDDAALDEFIAADGSPDDAEEITELQDQVAVFVAGCTDRSGEMLPHIGTAEVARDLDILRAVLGDDVLYYRGASYGTDFGAAYAELFPERVGRLVLDGAIDPSLTGEQFLLGQARGAERALTAFISSCVTEENCPLGESAAEARSTLINLLTVIDATPLPTDDDTRPLTQSLAVLGIVLPLYLSPDEGYPLLNLALERALAGDGSALQFLADQYLQRNPDGTFKGNMNEVNSGVNCVDRPWETDIEAIEAGIPAFEAASPVFGTYQGWSGLVCARWPVPPAAPAPVTAIGAAPILVIGTTGDLATPYEWAEALAAQLDSGILLTYEGSGHTAYRKGSECVDDAVDAYLIDGTIPEDGLRCT
jgi:pimeloyl-ACP methyl ester carboxylesterase